MINAITAVIVLRQLLFLHNLCLFSFFTNKALLSIYDQYRSRSISTTNTIHIIKQKRKGKEKAFSVLLVLLSSIENHLFPSQPLINNAAQIQGLHETHQGGKSIHFSPQYLSKCDWIPMTICIRKGENTLLFP